MLCQRIISLLRRGTELLPPKLSLRALTFIDCFIGSAEPENVYVPSLVPKERRQVAIDVGANNGVTTQIMSGIFAKVHAFEANPQLADTLKACVPKNVHVHDVALSSTIGRVTLSVPISSGVTLAGWGSLETPLVEKFERMIQIPVETTTLDSFQWEDVGLIKIDVEGHEMAVLSGARETISRCRPWLIVEALDEQQHLVRQFLLPLGYQETPLDKIAGRKGSAHNLVFIPASQS